MTPGEQARYASGEWLGSLECDNCDVQLEDDHECPITGSYVRVTK
jgi:hypothetical protein